MAQPTQTEAADGGANVAQLCAAQKLLYADAIAPAHPQNAAEAPTMENLKPLQLGGRDGPWFCGSCANFFDFSTNWHTNHVFFCIYLKGIGMLGGRGTDSALYC
jgi:hypothetical protein